MKFYQENKINPFASCLPLLAQMPSSSRCSTCCGATCANDICGEAATRRRTTASCCGEIADPTGAEQFLFIPDLTARRPAGCSSR